jgi:hypothetical protein
MHAKQGLGCADCHGGDPKALDKDQAHAPETGFVGKFPVEAIPDLCARCHSNAPFMATYNPRLAVDQYDKYQTSRHGELLAMGLRKVAECVSCHTAHNVRIASDPRSSVYPVNLPHTCAKCHSDSRYMAGFPIPTDQFEKYSVSVHGKALLEREDLGAPACNDCHGNHGAIPPGARSLAHVCGICHTMNMEMFEKSPHAEVFDLQELPQCTVCHQHHAIAPAAAETFNMETDSVCITCHRKDSEAWKQGKAMYARVAELQNLRDQAETTLDQAQSLGMDVSDGRFAVRDFRTAYFQLRTVSHELNMEDYTEKADAAKEHVTRALTIAQDAIDEFYFRREGLIVSLLLSLPVLLLLYLKVRALDTTVEASGTDTQKHTTTYTGANGSDTKPPPGSSSDGES